MKLCTNNDTPTHIELLHAIFLKGRGSQAKLGETEMTLMFVKTTVRFTKTLVTHTFYITLTESVHV